MATYPNSIPQHMDSEMEVDSGMRVWRTPSGKPVFRNWFTANRAAFRLVHEVGATDKASILSHYAGDWMNSFSFTYAATNTSYTVAYLTEPQCTPISGTNRWRVEVSLIEATS